jgi:hypothetical protein
MTAKGAYCLEIHVDMLFIKLGAAKYRKGGIEHISAATRLPLE